MSQRENVDNEAGEIFDFNFHSGKKFYHQKPIDFFRFNEKLPRMQASGVQKVLVVSTKVWIFGQDLDKILH